MDQASAQVLATAPSSQPQTRSRPRIVWADDDPDTRECVRRLLGPHYDVDAVADGEAALASVREDLPDLVLADVRMPRLDGFALLRALRDDPRTLSLPVVLVSARGGEEARLEGIEAGADEYLVKPFSTRELLTRVAALVKISRLRSAATRALHVSEARLEAENEALATLHALGSRLWSAHSLEDGLETMLHGAVELLAADLGSVQLLDADGRVPRIVAQYGFDTDFFARHRDVTVDNDSACGKVVRGGERVVIADIEADAVHAPHLAAARAAGYRALTCSPLIGFEGSVLGILSVYFRTARRPTEQDLRRLDVYARQAADFIERCAREREMRRRAEQFETLLNCAPMGVYLVDADLRFRAVNPMARPLFEAIDGGVIGRGFDDVVHRIWERAHADELVRIFRHTLETGEPYVTAEHAEVRLGGDTIDYYEWRLDRITLPDGRHGLVCYFRDISEHVRAREAHREGREYLRTLLGLLPAAVYTCEAPSGRITFYNEHAAELWGRAPAIGDTDERFCGSFRLWRVDGSQMLHHETPMALAMREDRAFRNQEVIIERPDGSRITVLVNIDPMHDEAGRVIGAINAFHDSTELRQAQQALREAHRRKDEFLATLAHELRNPLAPMANALSLMHARGDDCTTIPRVREIMERQLANMVRLVDDLLDISRITRGKVELRKERVDLSAVLTNALETSRPILDAAGHELSVSLPERPLHLHADPVRVAQVVSNLLNNAAKYTPRGGRVWLEVDEEAGSAVIRVRDTGLGIPADMLERIFDMFTQVEQSLERSHGGLGIGLTLVDHMVALHGGSVKASSDGPGRGSVFVVRLPLAPQPRSHAARPIEVLDAPDVGACPLRILVVDDNEDSAASLAALLELGGNTVTVAHDGVQAIEAARACTPDVVLLDIGLPGMNGYEVAERMRADPLLADVTLVAQTGWGQDQDRLRAREAGFDHHLVKPLDRVALDQVFAAVARRQRPGA